MRRKHEGKKREKGTALLVAILLCAIIGSAALGINAIALRQINISETYSNGLVAYYTAESGLEEGLLLYRYNKEIQIPKNQTIGERVVYRYFMNQSENMRSNPSNDSGTSSVYTLSDRQQVYDLQITSKEKYFGQDTDGSGFINEIDINNYNVNSTSFKIIKDEAKNFSISMNPASPTDNANRIYLFWKWLKPCDRSWPHALEVKLKIFAPSPATKDEYSALFEDPTCPGSNIANADSPSVLNDGVYTPFANNDLKTKMNISALAVKEMVLKPIGGKANSGDGIIFGFNQGSPDAATPTTSLNTTINSIGYFAGATREIDAHIDRQSGSILDLFNYVIYKGGR